MLKGVYRILSNQENVSNLNNKIYVYIQLMWNEILNFKLSLSTFTILTSALLFPLSIFLTLLKM